MSDREESLAESRALTRLLILLAERVKADFAQSVAPLQVPVSIARALLILATPTRMTELAEQLACNRSYVTGLADQLESRGLITRVAGQDRRVKLLELTHEGVQLRRQVSDAISDGAMISRLLTDTERQTLRPLLQDLLERYSLQAATGDQRAS